jgi:carbon monoxide dehydrogenase subunit G
MASIRREFVIEARAEDVWDAVRDVGALHKRLVPGLVIDCRLEPGARIVTFANGMTVKELIVDIDDKARRLVWSATGGRLAHHNASMRVFADSEKRTRVVWTADLLPNDLAKPIAGMIDQGCAAIKKTLERR